MTPASHAPSRPAPTASQKEDLIDQLNALYDREPWVAPIVSRGYVWAWQKRVKNLKWDILTIPFHSSYWLDEDA